MRKDNIEKLAEIESDLHLFKKEKQSLANVHEMFEEESQHSKGLVKALEIKDKRIAELLEEKDELLNLNEKTSDNKKSMRDLKNSIDVMKKHRSDLSKIRSRPRSQGAASVVSFDDSDTDFNIPSYSRQPPQDSIRTVPFSNESRHFLKKDQNGVATFRQSTADSYKSTSWDAEEVSEDDCIDFRLGQARRYAIKNSAKAQGRRVSTTPVPSVLDTHLDASAHSNVSLLETMGIGADYDLERNPASKYRHRTKMLDTHYEESQNHPMVTSRFQRIVPTSPSPVKKLRRRPRGSRPPPKVDPPTVILSDIEPISYRNMFSKRDDYTRSTQSPRSVFDVVDESVSRSKTPSMYAYRSAHSHSHYDSGGEDNDLCGFKGVLKAAKALFGLKHPVVRQWVA